MVSLIGSGVNHTVEYQSVLPIVPEVKAEMLVSTTTIKAYISQQAKLYGVDESLALRIAECESGFFPQQSKFIDKKWK